MRPAWRVVAGRCVLCESAGDERQGERVSRVQRCTATEKPSGISVGGGGSVSDGLFKTSGFTHERTGGSDQNEWLTPPKILRALGTFDLDPCAPTNLPWPIATHHFSSSGLEREWFGRVWCNPPYGPHLSKWLAKMAAHGNGIALTFARTETRTFQQHVFPQATLLLFIAGRLRFWRPDGTEGDCAAAPSVLIAYDEMNADALRKSGIKGAFVAPRVAA